MSASTIARWNAIPLERPAAKSPDDDPDDDDPDDGGEKPQYLRDLEGQSDGGDDISIASRTPSPKPTDIVDPMDVNSYRDHVRMTHQVITVDTRIKNTNKGFAMLARMGWREGTGLGLSDDARVDPVPFVLKADNTGIGKTAMDARVIEATVSQRRDLDSERQMRESEEQRKSRQDAVAQKEVVKTEISQTLRPFYCDICDKQYTNVGQYDEHCNTYAHGHKKRAKELQAAERAKNAAGPEAEARKDRERKREEKELRKLAKAAGVKLPTVPAPALPLAPPAATLNVQDKPSGFKKVGWSSVSSQAASSVTNSASTVTPTAASVVMPASSIPPATSSVSSGFKRMGWSSVPVAPLATPASETKASSAAAPNISEPVPSPDIPPAEHSTPTAPITTDSTSTSAKPTFIAVKKQQNKAAESARANWASFQRGAPPVAPQTAAPRSVATETSRQSVSNVPERPPAPTVKRGRSPSRSRSRTPPPRQQPGRSRSRTRSRSPRYTGQRSNRTRSRSRSRSRSPVRRRSYSRSRSRSFSRSRSRSRTPPPAPRHRLPTSSTSAYNRTYDRDRQDDWDRNRDRGGQWQPRGSQPDRNYRSSDYGHRP